MGWKWVVAKFHCCTFALGNPWDGTQTAQAEQERVAEGPSARSRRRTSAERNGHEWTSEKIKKKFQNERMI
jgi:hypothetical protein